MHQISRRCINVLTLEFFLFEKIEEYQVYRTSEVFIIRFYSPYFNYNFIIQRERMWSMTLSSTPARETRDQQPTWLALTELTLSAPPDGRSSPEEEETMAMTDIKYLNKIVVPIFCLVPVKLTAWSSERLPEPTGRFSKVNRFYLSEKIEYWFLCNSASWIPGNNT